MENTEWLRQLKVGDTIFVVFYSKQSDNKDMTVTKVGRKYLTLEQDVRISLDKGVERSSVTGMVVATAYVNESAYNAELALNKKRTKISQLMRENSHNITKNDIEQVYEILEKYIRDDRL